MYVNTYIWIDIGYANISFVEVAFVVGSDSLGRTRVFEKIPCLFCLYIEMILEILSKTETDGETKTRDLIRFLDTFNSRKKFIPMRSWMQPSLMHDVYIVE